MSVCAYVYDAPTYPGVAFWKFLHYHSSLSLSRHGITTTHPYTWMIPRKSLHGLLSLSLLLLLRYTHPQISIYTHTQRERKREREEGRES